MNSIQLFLSEQFEIHYLFNDQSHTIDAITLNKSQYEIIAIFQEIAKEINAEIQIDIEPYAEGGFRQIFKILSKQERKNATIAGAVVLGVMSGIIITPITKTVEKVTEYLLDKTFEDKEDLALDKRKKVLEIRNLELRNENLEIQNQNLSKEKSIDTIIKEEVEIVTKKLEKNIVVKKRKSNFYEYLNNYDKIKEISFKLEDHNHQTIKENLIKKGNFSKFILVSDNIDSKKLDNEIIEIISPVLKKGPYKWTGIYNGESIPFSMKSVEFKELVQKGEIEFKNGFTINCSLIINRKIDNEGKIKITGYEVLRVDSYYINDKPIETNEGKKHRKLKEAEKQMLKLFRYDDDDILPNLE